METLTPILTDPWGTKASSSDPNLMFLIKRAQMVLMALYFGGDHIVWAKSAGVSQVQPSRAPTQLAFPFLFRDATRCPAAP